MNAWPESQTAFPVFQRNQTRNYPLQMLNLPLRKLQVMAMKENGLLKTAINIWFTKKTAHKNYFLTLHPLPLQWKRRKTLLPSAFIILPEAQATALATLCLTQAICGMTPWEAIPQAIVTFMNCRFGKKTLLRRTACCRDTKS